MFSSFIFALNFLVVLIVIGSVSSWPTVDQPTEDEHRLDQSEVKKLSSLKNRLNVLRSKIPFDLSHRSESAEKYFNWASRSQRPLEYIRGKRFWLFTKKDDSNLHPELNGNAGPSNSLSQGIWRSGIVGRRR